MNPVILIVDDNSEIIDYLTSILSDNYTVLTASNGREALVVLHQQPVQLVVSDIIMPVMDGLELCQSIKSDVEHSHIPVILLTAKNSLQSKIEGLELGADVYIEKPFSPKHLQVQISSLILNRNKVKDHFASSPFVHIKSIAYTKADKDFLDKLNNAIYENITEVYLDVEHLAGLLHMSRPTLYRKIKAISNLSPHELINITRLKKAAELLAENHYKIYEISEMIGYSSLAHFRRNFINQFNMSPSEYVNKLRAENS